MPHSLSRRAIAKVLCLAVVAALADGCKSARLHRKEADAAALEAISEKQQQLGYPQHFTIERPADTLRRELMINQGLVRSSDASLSSHDVDYPKKWPEKAPEKPSTQPTTLPQAFPAALPDDQLGSGQADGGAIPSASNDAASESMATVLAYTPSTPTPLRLSLEDALKVGASNSREYQQRKEAIFLAALALDLARDDFRLTFANSSQGSIQSNQGVGQADPVNSLTGTTNLSLSRRVSNGMTFLGGVTFDVVKLLTGSHDSNYGMSWNAGITIPLLRNGGSDVVLEPLRQAERNLLYSLMEFEQYKRDFAFNVASQYYQVLSQYDQIRNAEAAYRRAIASTRRARRQADAGRLPEIQVDQSVQQELRARDRWIQAQANLGRRLDSFKIMLGLPPDANVVLDPAELTVLAERISSIVRPEAAAIEETGRTDTVAAGEIPAGSSTAPVVADPVQPGPGDGLDFASIELPPSSLEPDGSVTEMERKAIELAIANRPELRVAQGRIYDAQRRVIVAANALEAGLTLVGNASSGSRIGVGQAGGETGNARFDEGVYSGSLLLDLPLERTEERNAYRAALINFEAAVRSLQQVEDNIKADIRADIRDLMQAIEEIEIQARSVAVAEKRVASTNLFLEAGRAQIRDVLEAQDALVQAQNGLTSAVINYRLAELALQRDLGLLEVDEQGLWREHDTGLQIGRK